MTQLLEEIKYDKDMMEEYTNQLVALTLSHLTKNASLEKHFNLDRDLSDQDLSNLRKIAKDMVIKKLQRAK